VFLEVWSSLSWPVTNGGLAGKSLEITGAVSMILTAFVICSALEATLILSGQVWMVSADLKAICPQ